MRSLWLGNKPLDFSDFTHDVPENTTLKVHAVKLYCRKALNCVPPAVPPHCCSTGGLILIGLAVPD